MKVSILCLIALCGLSSHVESVAVRCNFEEGSDGYECEVKSLTITSKNDRTITQVFGYHQRGKSHSDIKHFNCDNQAVNFFPYGLTNFFKNLENVKVSTSSRLNEIYSSDLRQFGDKLKTLWLSNNAIEVLEADLFQFNPNLEYLGFHRNKIYYIYDGAFRGLEKLKHLELHGNICINKYATDRSDVIALFSEAEMNCKN